MAIDWGSLLSSGSQALTGYRQGTRERQEYERQQQIEESQRLFNEWAKRNQMEYQNRALNDRLDTQRDIAGMRNETALAGQKAAMDRAELLAQVRQAIADMQNQTRRRGQDLSALTIKVDTQGRAQTIDPVTNRIVTPEGDARFPLPGSGTGGSGRQTNAERQAAAQFEMMKPAYDRLKARFESGWSPSGRDKFGEQVKMGVIPDFLGNWIQSDEGQQMYDDLTSIVLSSQYTLSGKAVTEGEARRLARGLMPQIGDKPDRAAQKKQEIGTRLRVVMAAGGATEGIDTEPPPRLGSVSDPDEALAQRFLRFLSQRKKRP